MIILPGEAEKSTKKERLLNAPRVPRSARKNYLDILKEQVKLLKAANANISDLVSSGVDRSVAAGRIADLARAAQARMESLAPSVARSFVSAVDKANKVAVEKSIAKALTVDFASIVDGPEIGGTLDMALTENVNLIKSISSNHFADVARAVLDNYRGVPQVGGVSLKKRLKDIGNISDNRAKFIARDQTSKLTGDLNQIRQDDNGIEEYVWRTAKDRRVVGTPGGAYPKGNRGHENHYAREGETFKWSEPPGDGHPGQAYNCRCYAQPVLNLEKLKAKYV